MRVALGSDESTSLTDLGPFCSAASATASATSSGRSGRTLGTMT